MDFLINVLLPLPHIFMGEQCVAVQLADKNVIGHVLSVNIQFEDSALKMEPVKESKSSCLELL